MKRFISGLVGLFVLAAIATTGFAVTQTAIVVTQDCPRLYFYDRVNSALYSLTATDVPAVIAAINGVTGSQAVDRVWVGLVDGSGAVTRVMATGVTASQIVDRTWLGVMDTSQAVTRVMATGVTASQIVDRTMITGLTTTNNGWTTSYTLSGIGWSSNANSELFASNAILKRIMLQRLFADNMPSSVNSVDTGEFYEDLTDGSTVKVKR